MISFLGTELGDISFDAVLNENITATSTITSNPIETGAEVNDHIFDNPKIYTMIGGVSNISFNPLDSDIFNAVSGLFGESADGAGRKVTAWETLNRLKTIGEPFTVQSGLESIPNMVISGLEADNNASTYKSLVFTATLTQVIIVNSVSVTFTDEQLEDGSTQEQAAPNLDQGKVTKEPVTDTSVLRSIFDIFAGEE